MQHNNTNAEPRTAGPGGGERQLLRLPADTTAEPTWQQKGTMTQFAVLYDDQEAEQGQVRQVSVWVTGQHHGQWHWSLSVAARPGGLTQSWSLARGVVAISDEAKHYGVAAGREFLADPRLPGHASGNPRERWEALAGELADENPFTLDEARGRVMGLALGSDDEGPSWALPPLDPADPQVREAMLAVLGARVPAWERGRALRALLDLHAAAAADAQEPE